MKDHRKDHRINARVDDATQRRLDDLVLSTGQPISHVVREAIALYHVQIERARPKSKFLALVGKGDSGRSDVASNVKQHLTEILEAKFGLTPKTRRGSTKTIGSKR